jgi:hypothetical protein
MSWSPLQLRKIVLRGPARDEASLAFESGLNVICGASETGKSFLVEVLDYMLGGTESLRDLPECVGYDRGALTFETSDGVFFTIERSLDGGNFRLFQGPDVTVRQGESEMVLGAKHAHDREDTLSGWLLARTNLGAKRIRKNTRGDTQSLSFRNLARLVIVQEDEITKSESPFLSGQYVSRTSEFSALKLLLTGTDDSALVPDDPRSNGRSAVEDKVELIDQWLGELNADIDDVVVGPNEMADQLVKLDAAIFGEKERLRAYEQQLNSLVLERRHALSERERYQSRDNDVVGLLERFELLDAHYKVDMERLRAIEEAGTLFFHEESERCPLCGADPKNQHVDADCDGDVDGVVNAARAEFRKIATLSEELLQTVADLVVEKQQLIATIDIADENFRRLDKKISEGISPLMGSARASFHELVERRSELQAKFNLISRAANLSMQRMAILESRPIQQATESTKSQVSKIVLAELSGIVERILRAWHFPGVGQVYFDEVSMDFVINGKARGSRGKGLRAITHAAATIGLLEYCMSRNLPHPGFVILDSPLLAYWKPEGAEDNLQGTDLKDEFYKYLTMQHADSQIIIVENEHPPQQSAGRIEVTVFTKNPTAGRYGLFPSN